MSQAPEIREGLIETQHLALYRLHVVRPGRPKVLFLGGSNFDLRLKRGFLDTPVAHYCEIATYKPRGIGRTEQPDGAWSMRVYARDALGFLDAIGWSDAIILGESFGGMTALHLALLAPSRVRALVIASATAGGSEHRSYDISKFLKIPRPEAAQAAILLQDKRLVTLQTEDPEAFKRKLTTRLAFETAFADPSIQNGGYARLLAARRAHDCTQALNQITASTTIIAGRFDGQAHPGSQRALASGLINAEIHLFDSGHGLLFNLPVATQAALNAINGHHETKETQNNV